MSIIVKHTPHAGDPLDSSIRGTVMGKAIFVRLDAKPGKEKEAEAFLISALPLAMDESATVTWFALRFGPSAFAIFDSFPDEAGRNAHLSGKVAAALMAKAPDLFATAPNIEKADVLAMKGAE